MLCNFPINHVACVADTCCVNLVAGGTIILQERFDAAMVLKAVRPRTFDFIGWCAHHVVNDLEHPDFDETDLAVLIVGWGGAAMPVATIKRLQQIAPRMMNVYGMTETAANTTYTSRCRHRRAE